MHPENEVFYLIEVPGADRRYIERKMTAARYQQLKRDYSGCRVLEIRVEIPREEVLCDQVVVVPLVPELEIGSD